MEDSTNSPEVNAPVDNRPVTNARPLPPLPINYVPLRNMERLGRNTFAQNRTMNKAMGRVKPLRPNLLDEKDKELAQERAGQRRKAGTKWVLVY